MSTITISAHYDGEHVRFDEPIELKPNTRLLVTVLPDDERDAWFEMSGKGLEEAYGQEEEEYPTHLIKENNPDYEGR